MSAAAGAVGTLSVTSDPVGAAVYVDGLFVGQTPVSVMELATGDHRVRVVKDGYLENGRIATVSSGKTDTLRVRLTARAPAGATAQQPAALKIVVLEGEDGVNIIDKKTAVAPVVEVRDRNDLPVGGASVLFLIGGRNAATFANGARQLTVVTDSAGRATVSGLNPLGKGAFQIQVRATFQGQTATAAIHQVNFATAADAANAASSAGAASAGGGLSAAAIGGIVAGAIGGTAAAIAVARRNSDSNHAPTISAVTASPSIGLQGSTTVAFSAQASDQDNDTLTYAWDFGDGGTSAVPAPTHPYSTAGTFTVKLTVSDGRASTSSQTTVTIKTLTGTWLLSPSAMSAILPVCGGNVAQFTFVLTQSGTTVAGTGPPAMGTCGSWVISNSLVREASPQVTLTASFATFGFAGVSGVTFTGNPSSDVNTLTGVFGGFGALLGIANVPLTLTRQ